MIKKISLASSLRPGGRDTGKVVKYTPCTTKQSEDDLDEVAVISNAAPENIRYGSGQHTTANGPRVVPGIITSSGVERSRLVTSSLGGVSIVQRYGLSLYLYFVLYYANKYRNNYFYYHLIVSLLLC